MYKKPYKLYRLNINVACKSNNINIVDWQQGMKMKKHEELETPTFTTSIPIEVSSED